jgi:LmbE family N-acetylglucosaminyl deacetylase
MNPYHDFVAAFARLVSEGKSLPLGNITPSAKAAPAVNAPVVLIFSPHPDDECIIGGFALRLMREAGARVINVAVTQGSNRDRQQARWTELKNACDWIGFELERTAPGGLEKINMESRTNFPEHWAESVRVIAALLSKHRPRVILFPHEADWNITHIGTHFLVMDALRLMPATFECFLVETEFWAAMAAPNVMVELGVEDVADLLAALSFHVGEVRRNPYHLRMPAWLQDNVRRGAELVGGQGGTAPNFEFATLYRIRRWRNAGIQDVPVGTRQITRNEFSGDVFGWTR